MKNQMTTCLLGVLMLAGSLQGGIEEQKNIEAGSRAGNYAEKIAMYEKIYEEEMAMNEKVGADFASAPFQTSHPEAYHHPVSVSVFGDTVEFEDGSVWKVCSSDKTKTLDWMTSDILILTQNNSWFSSYEYCIVNLTTGVNIKVNMLLVPSYNGVFTHWVTHIDHANKRLHLNDGSIWEVGGKWVSYQAVLNRWLAKDTILIGVNADSNPSTPNVLINAHTNTWVKAKCIY